MATLKFRVKQSWEYMNIARLTKDVEGAESSVKPSKMSDQDVIVTITVPGDKLPPKMYALARQLDGNRAIHIIQ